MLLKGIDERGLFFFTNYTSRKSQEIEENPFASATIYWKELQRQVIIEGSVERLPKHESELYFRSRPRGSQIAAWTSKQDQPLDSYQQLEAEYKEKTEQFKGKEIPLPPFWGGFLLRPTRFEFWLAGEHRLHDRFLYKQIDHSWISERLYP